MPGTGIDLNYSLESGLKNRDSDTPPVHPLSLSFCCAELESDYARYHVEQSLKLARFGILLGIVLYLLFSYLDFLFVPQYARQFLRIRILISLWFAMALGLSFTHLINKGYQILMSVLVLAAGFGIAGMILISGATGGAFYYAGLILVIIYAHSLTRLRFIWASLTTWIIVAVYEIHTFALAVTPHSIGLNNTFFLLSANLLGMFASYSLEYYMRAVFWQHRMLAESTRQLKAEHQRKSQELEAARNIQLAMLPEQPPHHPEIDLAVSMKTATEIGGDYYDFLVAEDGTLTFVFGDATGHGAQAGAMVTVTKWLFANYGADHSVSEFLEIAARSLHHMHIPRLYMSLAAGRIKNGLLEIAGAGLPPAYLFKAGSGAITEVPLKGIPLGAYGSGSFKLQRIALSQGDAMILMTDGFPEQFNDNGKELGYDKAREIFSRVANLQPARIIDRFNRAARLWMNGSDQKDDMTFLVLKMKNNPSAPIAVRKIDKADYQQGMRSKLFLEVPELKGHMKNS